MIGVIAFTSVFYHNTCLVMSDKPITTYQTETTSSKETGVTINKDIPSAKEVKRKKKQKKKNKPKKTVMYATTSLNVRKKPNTKSKIVFTLRRGDKVIRIANGKDWDTIKVDGKKYYVRDKYISKTKPKSSSKKALYTPSQFRQEGRIEWGKWEWTWYSQKVLPGGGLKIPGRHVDENNYICDKDDYICLASSVLSKGTVIDTPFGKQGKIYDCGCAANVIDVYTNF